MPKTKGLSFNLLSIANNREIRSSINGREYLHILDGALLDSFKDLYYISPGKALTFLKAHCERWKRI